MKKIVTLVAALAAVAPVMIPVTAMAHTAHHTAAVSHALICPVTGTKIPSKGKAFGHSTYKGKTYYFCCPQCKPVFDKNPGKVIANAAKGKYQPM